MSTDTDLMKLYSGKILELASNNPRETRLDAPQMSVKRRSPVCGSQVTVDIVLSDGRVVDFGQDVKACALGQAAASVTASAVIGRSCEELTKARDQLRAMLRENGPVPDAPFDGFEALLPARAFKNRHASILLAIEATTEAAEKLQHVDCA